MTDTVVCQMSRGKESLGTLLQLRKFWPQENIIVVFQYGTPGTHNGLLSFIDASLTYYEQAFSCRIWRLPTPALFQRWYEAVYMPPERVPIRDRLLREKVLHKISFEILNNQIRERTGRPHLWGATGIRKNDSMTRRRTVEAQGSVHLKSRIFYPIWDWDLDRLLGEISDAGLKLAPDYQWLRASFEDNYFGEQMRNLLPDDAASMDFSLPLNTADNFRRMCNPALHTQQTGILHA